MAKKTFSRGIPLENPPSSPTLGCVGEGLVGETPHPKASTTAFGWFCIGMREGEFCERLKALVLSKERINRKDEGKNEPPTSVGEDSILPFCEILKLPCPRRVRRPRRPEKNHQINGQSRTPVPTVLNIIFFDRGEKFPHYSGITVRVEG